MAKTRDHSQLENRRKEAAGLFAKGHSAPEVARHLGVARQVAYRWQAAWEQGGQTALTSKGPAGRKAKLTPEQTRVITEALLARPTAHGCQTTQWTLPRVANLIEDLTGVRYHPRHVWRLLRASGFSYQRPERQAAERDDQAIRQWRQVPSPGIKEKPDTKVVPSPLIPRAD